MIQILRTATDFKPDDTAGRNFAEEAAASAFGKNYVHPPDREFIDRPPSRLSVRLAPQTWHKLSDVLADVHHKAGVAKHGPA